MDRFICIHAHFYQPPRENPWLEEVELQHSAKPYHDWNQKIMAECYAPNGHSRILDGRSRVVGIVNNYTKISFNFGPTLLTWMRRSDPDTYERVLQADKESQQAHAGHGSAIAQAYNHIILPLANSADKYTQVRWGIRDFEHRFKRYPEGMWLAETAVDLQSLDILAEQGIKFTILSPYQAERIRKLGEEDWQDARGGKLDPRIPYTVKLPSGRSIVVFFYDGPVSRAVAFEGLLKSGVRFAKRLSGIFNHDTGPQLVHIATDGESYGHHHRYGDMALAYAIEYIQRSEIANITNYAEYLSLHPPQYEAEIVENSAWSCAHGIERWRKHCGCNSGYHRDWNQNWRTPLRESLDWLRDQVAFRFENEARQYLNDPWHARNDYIDVILDRSRESVLKFLEKHQNHPLADEEQIRVLQLMEIQRHSMLMYTSCGWFFDDISGIETVQCLQYAGRVIQIAERKFGWTVEGEFLQRLAEAKSNLPEHENGKKVYEKCVKPAIVDFADVTAHFAISSLFEPYEEESDVFSYSVKVLDHKNFELGGARLVLGKVEIRSAITWEKAQLFFAAIHLGGHTVNAAVRYFESEEKVLETIAEAEKAFMSADFAELIRVLDRHFGGTPYSIRSLFKDQQNKVLEQVMKEALEELEHSIDKLYKENTPVMRFLYELGTPLPRVYRAIAEFARNSELKNLLEEEYVNFEQLQGALNEIQDFNLTLDVGEVGLLLQSAFNRQMERLKRDPLNEEQLENGIRLLDILHGIVSNVDLWKAQNTYFSVLDRNKEEWDLILAEKEHPEWMKKFRKLGEKLNIRIG